MIRPAIANILAGATCCGVLAGVPSSTAAQTPGQTGATFDVASIRPNLTTTAQMVIRTLPGGRLEARNVTPKFLVRYAFATKEFLIVDAPDWTTRERFDVAATGPVDASPDATRERLRSLLSERFGLRTHTEIRKMQVYTLVRSGRDDRLGENFRRSDAACVERDRSTRGSPPKALPSGSESVSCGLRMAFGHVSGGSVSMSELADALSQSANRPVLDQTGLEGRFDFVVNFTPEAARLQAPFGDIASPSVTPPPVDMLPPLLITALQDQVGLKLELTTSPVEVLVIDGIDKATPN